MYDRIPQSVAKRVVFKAFLAADHVTAATGKTIAMQISKNGAAFANIAAGATNATEIASGWYYVDLAAGDTGTLGPLIVRGTEGTIDPGEVVFSVEVAVATQASVDTIDDFLDTEVAAIKAVTDNLATAIELDGAVYRFTTNALEQAPTGGGGGGLDAAGVRAAVGLASANLDTQLDALPTATENADALLKRDMSAVTEGAGRTPLQALRFLRNKWSIGGGTLTVTKEDDTTASWTASVTGTAGADPVTGVDPA